MTPSSTPSLQSPCVIGHRGARWLAVENTLESLRVAFEEGAGGVEFDVQLTRDGELVLFHDDTLDVLAGRHDRIADLDWRELRGVQLRDRHGHTGRMPHLHEVIDLLGDSAGLVNLELKVVDDNSAALTEAVVAALLDAGTPAWLLSSFDGGALKRLSTCGVPFSRGLLIDDDPTCDWWSAAESVAAISGAAADVGGHLVAVHPHGRLVDAERMAMWRGAGMQVNVWTLNGAPHWSAAVQAGVNAVMTDDPGGLRAWLAGEGLS